MIDQALVVSIEKKKREKKLCRDLRVVQLLTGIDSAEPITFFNLM